MDKKVIAYWPLFGIAISIIGLFFSYYAFVSFAICSYFTFNGSINALQVVGPVYWIHKNNAPKKTPLVASGFMHETSAPWRIGKGIQVRCGSHTFQVGFCKKQNYDETEGTLSSIQGRFLDVEPTKIGEW